jgi:hypothetical protein
MNNLQNIRMLVDQANERIIWLTVNPLATLPVIQPGFNYRNYYGPISKDDYVNYNNFDLFYNVPSKSLRFSKLPFESEQTKNNAIVARYRCQAFGLLNNVFNFHVERYNLSNSRYLESIDNESKDDWVTTYQNIFNCSKDSASKLLDFKISEHKKSNFKLESARLEMITKLNFAKTTDEIKFILDTTNIKLMNVEDSVL